MRAMEARRRSRPIALTASFLVATWLVATSGCKDGTTTSSKEKAQEQGLPVDAGSLPVTPAPRASESSTPLETLEFGVTGTELQQYAGTMDVKNRYASAVMVSTSTGPGLKAARCSGVLISPRLVLTLGSCLCEPRKRSTPGGEEETLIDGSTCARRASVTTVLYGDVLDPEYPESATQMEPHAYEGEVRPHPELRLLLDARGFVKSEHADLAVMVLDEPVKDVPPAALLEEDDVQAQESLVMAGYASAADSSEAGGLHGIRYFRKNKVTRVLTPEDGRALYEQQGPSIYNGYPGGPCFREQGARRWLVGIASRGSDQELPFTRVASFREWLRAELRRASRLPLAPTMNSGSRR